jgi:hypothetical protein
LKGTASESTGKADESVGSAAAHGAAGAFPGETVTQFGLAVADAAR